MLRFLLDLLVAQARIRSSHRTLLQFTDRELEDVGLLRIDIPDRP
jgi:uncharacterized protein YjiS (DUF1127 family)